MAMMVRTLASLMLLVVGLLFSGAGHAFLITIPEKQLNTMVDLSFPQTRIYEGIIVTFSDPQVELSALDNDVTIKVRIDAEYLNMKVAARGEISGELRYKPERKELQLAYPVLEEFDLINDTDIIEKALLNTLKRMKGMQFPVILLLDFNDLDLSLFGNQPPKSIEIRHKRLLIEI
jgi:hypothetical protein